ncbi:chemotaxis protein CheB [Streptomyces venezuelae]|uniref:chemotaxis protein CheB n=1 Tax=Streptomyces venezuelae TaxID=54571 RepID=UPI00341FB037
MFAAAQSPSAAFDVVCLTASLGGVSAYREILSALPVRLLRDADQLSPGVVHVVPGGLRAAFSPECGVSLHPVHDHSAADPTCTSAAAAFGPRLLVAVLTGRQQDGALGVRHVRGAGGRALAQDLATSEAPGMPSAAMATGCADFVLPLPVLAHALISLVMVPGAADMMRVSLPPWAAVIPSAMAT